MVCGNYAKGYSTWPSFEVGIIKGYYAKSENFNLCKKDG